VVPDVDVPDVGGEEDGGGDDGGGDDGGGDDGGGDDDDDFDGFGDAGEENLEVGDGDAVCFREPGAVVPGCGATPPAELPGEFEPGRFDVDRFE
jgi:hypothetical protein